MQGQKVKNPDKDDDIVLQIVVGFRTIVIT